MIESLLVLIDVFGRPVTINFSGREKFNSRFGGVCSLLLLGFIIWALYNGSQDLFTRSNPNTINSVTYSENPLPLILSSETFPIGIGLQGPASMDLRPYLNESIYTVDFLYMRIYTTTAEDGSIIETRDNIILDKEICTPSHFGEQAGSFVNVQLNATYCIAKNQSQVNQVRIQGTFTSPTYELILVLVSKCNNLTSVCAEPEVMDQYLTAGWFNVLYVDMAVNPKNYSHPDTRFRVFYSTMISPSNYKETTFELGIVDVTTDSGWLVSQFETKEYIKVNDISEVLQFSPNLDETLLFTCNILASSIKSSYSRSYKTIQNVLAEVGGLANVALAVLFIITTPYLKLKFCLSLINELFDIHQTHQKQKKRKQKNMNKNKTNQADSIVTSIQEDPEKKREKSNHEVQLTKQDKTRGENIKSNPTNESLFPKSPFSRKSKGIVNEKEPSSSSPVYLPISLNSPVSQQGEKAVQKGFITISMPDNYDSNVDKAGDNYDKQIDKGHLPVPSQKNSHDNSREDKEILSFKEQRIKKDSVSSFKPNLEGSRSSSWHLIDQSSLPEQKVDRKMYSQKSKDDTLEMTKKDKEKLKLSFFEDKPEMHKLDQKHIEHNDNYAELSFVSMEDQFYDSGVENMKSETNNIFSQRENAETVPEKRTHTMASVKHIQKNTISDASPSIRKTVDIQKPQKIDISFWEYVSSFVYQTESIKEKMDILAEGMKSIEERLDVISILKKLREIDKIKAMLLDSDQAVLFNNLPNPEIKSKALRRSGQTVSFTHKLLRKSEFLDKNESMSMVFDSHIRIEEKEKKTKIDQRLIDVFKEKT